MLYTLDTNVVSALIGESDTVLAKWKEVSLAGHGVRLNALSISASIYQTLSERGTLLEDADILIAGRALAHGATLVNRNFRHFERVDGLRLETWERAGGV